MNGLIAAGHKLEDLIGLLLASSTNGSACFGAPGALPFM